MENVFYGQSETSKLEKAGKLEAQRGPTKPAEFVCSDGYFPQSF